MRVGCRLDREDWAAAAYDSIPGTFENGDQPIESGIRPWASHVVRVLWLVFHMRH